MPKRPATPARKSRGSPAAESPKTSSEQSSDHASLDSFCDQIELTEMTVDRWTAIHDELDLTVFVFLTPDEAALGCCKEVKFSRLVTSHGDNGQVLSERIRCTQSITLPRNTPEGQQIEVSGLGDQQNGVCGTLQIIVRIRK